MSRRKRKAPSVHDLVINIIKDGQWILVLLNGKFVVKSSALVRKQFDKAEAASGKRVPRVVIDMTRVTQVDSSALTFLLNFQKRLQEKKGRLVVVGPNPEIMEMFLLVGFNLAVEVFETHADFEKCESA